MNSDLDDKAAVRFVIVLRTLNIGKGTIRDNQSLIFKPNNMKELELARFDRQIAEERQRAIEPEAIKRFAKALIDILSVLRGNDAISDGVYEELTSLCVLCGAEGEEGLEYHKEMGKDDIGLDPDDHLDINPVGGSLDAVVEYHIHNGMIGSDSALYRYSDGSGDGDGNDGNLTFHIRTECNPKAHIIMVNGTDSGLHERDDGSHRYTADSQLYLFYLNVSNAFSPFTEGLNMILVPRSVALSSQLNYSLMHSSSIQSTDPIYELGFASTNMTADNASASIVAMLSGNVTGTKAMEILHMVCHNDTSQIAENRTVDSDQFYLLGLPDDVVQAVPLTEIVNSPLGDGPSEVPGWLGTLQQIVGFLLQGWIEIVNFFVEVFEAAVEMFLDFVANLADDVVGAVTAAVKIIVDSFMAFLDWAISFIQDIVDMVFGPIVEAISDLVDSYCSGVQSALNRAEMDVTSTGSVSSSSLSMLSDALNGDLFWVLLGLGVLIDIILLAISPITISFGFFLMLALEIIITYLVIEAFKAIVDYFDGALPTEGDADSIFRWALAIGDGPSVNKVAISTMGGSIGIVSLFYGAGLLTINGVSLGMEALYLAFGAISILLGWTATMVDSPVLGLFSLAIAGGVLYHSFKGIKSTYSNVRYISLICFSFGLIGTSTSAGSILDV